MKNRLREIIAVMLVVLAAVGTIGAVLWHESLAKKRNAIDHEAHAVTQYKEREGNQGHTRQAGTRSDNK